MVAASLLQPRAYLLTGRGIDFLESRFDWNLAEGNWPKLAFSTDSKI
jgi:hypothetical protein